MTYEFINKYFSNEENIKSKTLILPKEILRSFIDLKASKFKDPDKEKWFFENYSFIQREIGSISLDKSVYGSLFYPLFKLYSESLFEISESDIETIFDFVSRKFDYSEKELGNIKLILKLSIVLTISESEKNDFINLEKHITDLHILNEMSFDRYIEKYNNVERILSRDEEYGKLTKESQFEIKKRLISKSKKEKTTPEKLLKKYQNAGNSNQSVIDFLDKEKHKSLYFPIILMMFAFFEAALYLGTANLCATLLLSVPLYFFTKKIVDYFYSLSKKPETLLGYNVKNISNETKTLVTTAIMISSEKDVDDCFEKLKTMNINNKEKGDKLFFGLICDLPQSNQKTDKADDILIEYINKKTESMNENDPSYFCFVRKREYSKTENVFMGRERKRGSIEDFINFVMARDVESDFEFFGTKEILGAKYLISLDSDTLMNIGQIKRLVGIISHPENKAKLEYKNGEYKLKSGYSIIQPLMSFSLQTRIKTRFGKIYANGSGENIYAFSNFNNFQTIFGKGIFCGKGIIDIDSFSKLCFGKFKSETVLSHDIPEGALSGVGIAANEHFSDSFPHNSVSEYKRNHRWTRGDTQNLWLINKVHGIYKYLIIENVILRLVPLFELSAIVFSAYISFQLNVKVILFVLFFHFENVLTSVLSILIARNFNIFTRRFSKKMRNVILNAFYSAVISVFAIAFDAFYYSDAVIRAIFRRGLSKKHLLQWQIYSPSENGDTLSFFLPILFLTSVLLFFCRNFVELFLIIAFLFYPFLCYILSLEYKENSKITEREEKLLRKYAKNTFNYFEKTVYEETNFLPPDNIQFYPIEKIAMRTSPTNIGLYLLSLVSAFDLKIITETVFLKRINDTVRHLYKLEKYQGHLYNWYDIKTLTAIGDRFVSTVDSGNFVASLVILRETLSEINTGNILKKEIIADLDQIIKSTDFSILFDKKENLFYVGINENGIPTKSHYDLYMSESRITSFLSIAKGDIDIKNWKILKRPIISKCGRCGAVSWTGTAFEYFLAPQFIPVIENSFEDECLDFALYCQKKDSQNITHLSKIFGKSESLYYAFDNEKNYQYKAFGNEVLSVSREFTKRKVFSPYSLFLFLPFDKSVMKQLEIYEKKGFLSDLGFFDAVDFNSNFIDDYEIIKAVMAHHSGMTMISINNALNGFVLSKRFLKFENFNTKTELLCERFPIEIKAEHKSPNDEPVSHEKKYKFTRKRKISDEHAYLLSDGLSSFIFSNGKTEFKAKNDAVISSVMGGINFLISGDNFRFDLNELKDSKIIYNSCELKIIKEFNKTQIISEISLIPKKDSILFSFQINGYKGKISFSFDFLPILCDIKSYLSHPEFNDLQVEVCGKDKKFTVRKREADSLHKNLRIFSTKNLSLFLDEKKVNSSSFIPIIDSKCDFKSEFEVNGCDRVGVIIEYDGKGKPSHPLEMITSDLKVSSNAKRSLFSSVERINKKSYYDNECFQIEKEILAEIFERKKYYSSDMNSINIDTLWQFGISGDVPIVSHYVFDKGSVDFARKLMSVNKKLHLCGIYFDLVIMHDVENEYFMPMNSKLTNIIEKYDFSVIRNSKFGLHIVSVPHDIQRKIRFLSILSFGFENELMELSENSVSIQKKQLPDRELKDVGKYINNGFEFCRDKKIKPFSYILAEKDIGTFVFSDSLGFTWFSNAALGKVTSRRDREKLLLFFHGNIFDLMSFVDIVTYKNCYAEYRGKFFQTEFSVLVFTSENLSAKCVKISFSEKINGLYVGYSFIPENSLFYKIIGDTVLFSNVLKNDYFDRIYVYSNSFQKVMNINGRMTVISSGDKECDFIISCGKFEDEIKNLQALSALSVKNIFAEKIESFNNLFSEVKSQEEFRLIYQTYYSRIIGRSGPMQAGGAIGFRDQLQDVTALIDFDKNTARNYILKAASHQFSDGQVMHWWHESNDKNIGDRGLRSKCSDDYLWLIFSTYEYVNITGDKGILNSKSRFLIPGKKDEEYNFFESGENEPLIIHLEKCAELFIDRGLNENGLAPILKNDWNDGLDNIGGEGTWLSEFGVICLERLKSISDNEKLNKKIDLFIDKALFGIKNSFNGKFFIRGYDKFGNSVGNDLKLQSEMSIDILPQAFSAFLYIESEKARNVISVFDIKTALDFSYQNLFDKNKGIVRLFTKPYSETTENVGYIKKYCPGLRENGGQYTHAAVWFCKALLDIGEFTNDENCIKMAVEVFNAILTFNKTDFNSYKTFKREPYVICGDIYTALGNEGRGGWNWYSGSSGWLYQVYRKIKKYL